ncbi:hypothetical protein BAUCODRAFT_78681 [Baudoinia panamericana UAMH 10762]|uniref:Protein CASP n=1 Tax=Baudoinia panamericana (strain UAMH 10762) TaxID=717646 RepID=M2LEB8_BAUPA|nr:uncharacterized protein BAUCODRAFT_78681 [Baudoinia panamericana UAMH 10762]EMC92337.1 hypothetical protein BAUCODRAFT_78681 [Baudoinia panamericana UAMH 10762]
MADSADVQASAGALSANGNGTDHEETNGIREAIEAAGGGNKFQQAVAAWRALNLTKLVSTLDTVASDLVEHQRESLVQRKELAQKTKDFRKLEDAAKLVELKDMLKAYQTYIDALTNHSKAVQTAFMQAYSPLSEAPDPYPLLEASIDSLVTADEVMPKLEAENERLHKQVTKLTSELEETEKQLEDERTKRQSFEGSQDSRLKEVEDSWSAVLREKEENWSSRERNLEEKVENQDRLLKELKASYEVSQRLDRSGGEPEDATRSGAAQAELELVSSELERANVRLAELEARNEQLRVDLAQSTGQAQSLSRGTAIEDDPAFSRLRSENQSLMRRLDASRYEKDAERSNIEGKLRSLEREVGGLKADRDALQSKVRKWSDYDEVKRELDMLRAIEFATVGDEDGGEDADTDQVNGASIKGKEDSLEQLLLARNKKLSNELTELRVSHNELIQRLELLQEDLSNTNMELEKTRNLNATLESDLQKTQQEASNAFETMSVAGTHVSRYPARSTYGSRRGGGTSPTSSIIGGLDPSFGSGSPRGGESGAGILPMVTAQRDRFKKKISELEQELQKQYQSVSSLRSEVASLQRDNLTLYEKTRYVSTYNRAQPTTSGSSYGPNPNPSTISMGVNETDQRYRSAYESNISPFAAFRSRESTRAMKRMSLPERAVWQMTRMVLATRTSRNLFAGYCLACHLLILMMLYWWATVDIEKHSTRVGTGGPGGWEPEGMPS